MSAQVQWIYVSGIVGPQPIGSASYWYGKMGHYIYDSERRPVRPTSINPRAFVTLEPTTDPSHPVYYETLPGPGGNASFTQAGLEWQINDMDVALHDNSAKQLGSQMAMLHPTECQEEIEKYKEWLKQRTFNGSTKYGKGKRGRTSSLRPDAPVFTPSRTPSPGVQGQLRMQPKPGTHIQSMVQFLPGTHLQPGMSIQSDITYQPGMHSQHGMNFQSGIDSQPGMSSQLGMSSQPAMNTQPSMQRHQVSGTSASDMSSLRIRPESQRVWPSMQQSQTPSFQRGASYPMASEGLFPPAHNKIPNRLFSSVASENLGLGQQPGARRRGNDEDDSLDGDNGHASRGGSRGGSRGRRNGRRN